MEGGLWSCGSLLQPPLLAVCEGMRETDNDDDGYDYDDDFYDFYDGHEL